MRKQFSIMVVQSSAWSALASDKIARAAKFIGIGNAYFSASAIPALP
jgi:hypothetical protein